MSADLNPIEHVWEEGYKDIKGTANKSAATGSGIASNMMENSSGFNKSLHKYAYTFTRDHSKR